MKYVMLVLMALFIACTDDVTGPTVSTDPPDGFRLGGISNTYTSESGLYRISNDVLYTLENGTYLKHETEIYKKDSALWIRAKDGQKWIILNGYSDIGCFYFTITRNNTQSGEWFYP